MQDSVHCLSRDDELVKTIMPLQWTRKSLLSRLAALVKQSEKLAQQASNPMDEDAWQKATSDVLQKAYEVAVGLVTFMDAWEQHIATQKQNTGIRNSIIPPSPVDDSQLRTPTDSHILYELPTYETDTNSIAPSASISQVSSERTVDNRYAPARRSTTPKPSQSAASPASLVSRPSESDLQAAERADRSMMDFVNQLNGPSVTKLASVMLTNAQTEFFDNIKSFLKLYTQSGQTDEIDMIVLRTLGSSSSLMAAVHKIRTQNPSPRQNFDESLKIFSQCLNNLSMSLPVPEESRDNQPSFINPISGAALISVATICIRAAAQCVSVARRSLEEHGDFEIGDRIIPEGKCQENLLPAPAEDQHVSIV